ncbi:Type 1 glutamine amidotransferase-like domain-containing protein [Paenibacillus physcomitrellae]|uniref:Peptidase S51 n=1 Tax=Paenibacillus physcomitrellae TaxID=1619311 RepID=A0ABQ1FNK3_9BACL|nr:Type 1 glutamine amidotransferase-like domain-containing protein [Paenibacillus physcomitrellae]GGA24071.1 hypothetical protein GCM10010917_06090 [Paenibacillus physcomitrellae]
MSKLVMFSDLIEDRNVELHRRLLELLGNKNPSIGYIPSSSDLERRFFSHTAEYYRGIGIHKLDYIDLDLEFHEETFSDLFAYDAIHLSGGNTFYFLELLKRRGILNALRKYAANGGILIGVSAGSILMTPTIGLAGFGEEADLSRNRTEDLQALGLVSFEFLPHWDGTEEAVDAANKYARERKVPVYMVQDGGGVVVDQQRIEQFGEVRIVTGG